MGRKFDFNVEDVVDEIDVRKTISNTEIANNTITDATVVQEINISSITEDEVNDAIYDYHGIEALSKSIQEHGITNPLRVYKMPNSDKYLLQGGHRRKKAALMANLTKVPAIVLEWEPDPKLRKRYLIDDNLNNREKGTMETARELYEYANTYDTEHTSEWDIINMLSEKTGRSTGTIRRYLSLLNLIPELQAKADNGNYSMAALSEAKVMTIEQQQEFNALLDEFVMANGEDAITKEIILSFAKSIKSPTQKMASKKSSKLVSSKNFKNLTKKYSDSLSNIELLEGEELQEAIRYVRSLFTELENILEKYK